MCINKSKPLGLHLSTFPFCVPKFFAWGNKNNYHMHDLNPLLGSNLKQCVLTIITAVEYY